jgi:hypothetical protein
MIIFHEVEKGEEVSGHNLGTVRKLAWKRKLKFGYYGM